MAGLVPAIYVFGGARDNDVDARAKPAQTAGPKLALRILFARASEGLHPIKASIVKARTTHLSEFAVNDWSGELFNPTSKFENHFPDSVALTACFATGARSIHSKLPIEIPHFLVTRIMFDPDIANGRSG